MRHTVTVGCCLDDDRAVVELSPQDDCCDCFRSALGDSIAIDDNRFVMLIGCCHAAGDGHDDASEEDCEVYQVPITHCPWCGA